MGGLLPEDEMSSRYRGEGLQPEAYCKKPIQEAAHRRHPPIGGIRSGGCDRRSQLSLSMDWNFDRQTEETTCHVGLGSVGVLKIS